MQAQRTPLPISAHAPRRTRLARQRQVVTVLTRHGFGLLVQRSRVPVPGRARLQGRPEGLRQALQELGTTFVKLGQILSTRSDILPDDYVAALSTLQDRLPPVSLSDVELVIMQELGAPAEELFAWFDPVPLATASIGQVHAATLQDGTPVVVKVQKPGIVPEVQLDLSILHDLAHLAAERIDLPMVRNLEEAVEHFSDSMRDELDFTREALHAERFARLLSDQSRVAVPRIYWDYTTQRVLTMQRLHGVKITDLEALSALGVDRHEVARDLADLVFRQVFEHGFFHADPHPGNYIVQANGTIGMMDFGLVGSLDDGTRRDLLLLLIAWVRDDADGLAEGLLSLGVARGNAGMPQLRSDMRRVLGRYQDARLQEIDLSRVLGEIFHLARRNHLMLRGDLALLAKTLGMLEGLGRVLDPRFHMVGAAKPFVEGAIRRMYLPHPDAQAAALNLGALFDLTANLPQRANRLLGRLERGDLGLAVRPEGVDGLMRDLNRMVNRLSITILAAAFIVGLALLLQVVESTHGSLLLLGLFASGLLAAGVLGLWLLISMYQAGRLR